MLQLLDDNLRVWGGESFIQIITGANFAFFLLARADPRFWFSQTGARDKVLAALLQISDTHRSIWGPLMFWIAGALRRLNNITWTVCRFCALALAITGLCALYVGGKCSYSVLLILPVAFYLLAANAALVLLFIICYIVRRNTPKGGQDITSDMDELRKQIGASGPSR